MKFTLIDNGADSLKSAYENIEKLDELLEGGQHRIKDAVIFLNHGVEILLKLILKKHSPSLMFEKIPFYMDAKKKLKHDTTAKNVFDIDKSLKTVSLLEALKRVEFLCDIEIPESLNASILYVNGIRNQVMHYEVDLSDDESSRLVSKLKFCYEESVKFLEMHIENLSTIIEDSRFEITHEDYEDQEAEIYAEMQYEMEREAYLEDMHYEMQREMREEQEAHEQEMMESMYTDSHHR
ncbi:hypothetical protein [Paenisporosarcina sp.]|uniref:hypothetical protein n=1 Tax=Paenisporosarcina sp. TaxID=1932001 RepID=UPI003C71E18A